MLREAVEVTAIQRGVAQWAPDPGNMMSPIV